jgi:hypothetical protein
MPTFLPSGRRTRTPAVRCLPIVLAACGGATDAAVAPPPAGPTPAIAVASAAALTVEPGGSATTTVRVTRAGGFGGTVDLALADLPAGITATLAPGTLASDVTQSVITTTVDAGVAPGSYALAVTGSGAGVRAARITIPVTVAGGPPAPAITVAAPSGVTIAQGATGTATVGFARTHFTGDVTVSLEAAPAGISAERVTVPAGASAGVLGLSVAAGVTTGARALTVRLAGPGGEPTATTTLALTVAAAPAVPAARLDGVYLGLATNGVTGRIYDDYWTFFPTDG